MVEQSSRLNLVFGALADPTRRDILLRVGKRELTVGEVAKPYDLTFAAVSKHLGVLEKARLIRRRRHGRTQLVHAAPAAVKGAEEYLRRAEAAWNARLDRLEAFLKKEKN